MRLLVNTLSIGSMSGNHVVYGFLRPYSRAILPENELHILHYEGNPPPQEILDLGAVSIPLSDRYRNWAKRTVWETLSLPGLVKQQNADVVLTVSGALLARCPVPQAVLCQNPWCYRPIVHRNWKERLKAKLQRIGYGKAYERAGLMLYISGHLRELYKQDNPGRTECPHDVAYVGLNDDTYAAAEQHADLARDPFSILSVSAMAAWKGAHTLVDAVGILRKREIPATLRLVGPWPDQAYEAQVRKQIEDAGLGNAVTLLGRVSDEELHRQYAVNQVYALSSHCESFGIPAAEAMAFGTPIISTDCCAISEVCEPAGKFGPAEDPNWTADALQELLTNQDEWNRLSAAAKQRAAILRWSECFKPFLRINELA